MKPVSASLPVTSMSRSRPDPAADLVALGRRPLVVPQDRRAQRPVAVVEQDRAVHLARQAHGANVRAADAGAGQRRANRDLCSRPTTGPGSCSLHSGAGTA